MDIFTKFNKKSIEDRQVDTLIGLSKGITADGTVNQAEAEFLQTWLAQNHQCDNPIIINLFDKVSSMLDDGVLDREESSELFSILRSISGDNSELGEVAKTSSLPVCSPPPDIEFDGKSFLFTGTCVFGSRRECQQVVESMGGLISGSVTKKLDYLVLGTYVTDSWIHESFGRKIEKAMAYRDCGVPLSIVTEAHWLEAAGL